MKHKLLFIVGMIWSLAFSRPLSAAILPNEIQDCVSNAVCSTPVLVQQESTFSAYSYLDEGTSKFLFEYNLWPESNESTEISTTNLTGAAWLSANETYDLTQTRHFFTLYLDGVIPTPSNLWIGDSDGLEVGLSMPTSDLLAGSSFFRLYEDYYGDFSNEGNLITHGDLGPLLLDQSLVPCLAVTCDVGARINLLHMQYVQSGSVAQLSLNPGDPRELLYTQYSAYWQDGSFISQTYGAVPVPAAVWLFGSGLIGLIGIARRKA